MSAPPSESTPSPAAAEAEARLSRFAGKVPTAVLEDAQRQVAGMLSGLQDLAGAFPVLDKPLAPWGEVGSPPLPLGEAARSAGEGSAATRSPHHSPLPEGEGTGSPAYADLLSFSISALSQLIRRREVSPVEVTRRALDRIQAHDGALHTFITLTPDLAQRQAAEAEREIAAGRYRGPLHGVPLAAKDLYETRGVRTTAGSSILRDWVPDQDAASVVAWREAGAVLLGKNTLHEFAFGGTSVNQHTGTPRNPWNPDHMCGGSSGGSAAAVAAGFAYGAFGSETGNSVRRPAAFCGVVGLKPTFGRFSRRGVFPLAWSLDHVGVFARTAADAALLVNPLPEYDAADPGSRRAAAGLEAGRIAPVADLRGRRVGVPVALLSGTDPEVEVAFRRALGALEAAGAAVQEVDLPLAARWTALTSSVTMQAEAAALHARWLAQRVEDYGADVLARLLAGASLTAPDYARAQAVRAAVTAELLHILDTVDVLIAPGTLAPAPALQGGALVAGDAPFSTQMSAFHLQRLFSLTGVPAASAPAGLSSAGLPMAVQIAGRPWDESTVLGVAQAIMAALQPPAVAPL